VLFTNKDANLNNAHFRYLEARLIQRGNQAKRAKLVNGNQPGMPQLSEADVADAEAFLENMLLIYPLVGIDAFEVATPQPEIEVFAPTVPAEQFEMVGRGVKATGRLAPDGFLVEGGSTAVGKAVPSFSGGYLALRNELIRNGVLVPDGDQMRFTQDFSFKSPSAAGSVVRARHTNGRMEWKTADGRTLAQVQEAQIDTSADLTKVFTGEDLAADNTDFDEDAFGAFT
jgi:hypothetical protein